MSKEYVVYQGDNITIEWYYKENGRSPALEYFETLSIEQKDKLAYIFAMLNDLGKIFDIRKFRYEGNSIFVFKLQQERFFCFFATGSKIIITNAYRKKTQKISQNEKLKALKARDDYSSRSERGAYYD